jgi:flagellar biosynthesis protein FlhA
MSDTTAAQSTTPAGAAIRTGGPAGGLLARLQALPLTDLGLAIGVIGILIVLILPMPGFLLDMLLAISITFSVLILMTSLFIQKPLEFSSFPVILLIATMLRLALNLASTRLILAHGHEGTQAAGHVI